MAASDKDLELLIVARFKDEAAAGLAALEARTAAFAATAPKGATELGRASDELGRSAQASADRLSAAAEEIAEQARSVLDQVRKASEGITAPASTTTSPGAPSAKEREQIDESRAAVERYVAALASQREALRLTDQQRIEALALLRGEALALQNGGKLRDEDREAILREIRATTELQSQLQAEATAKALVERASREETASRLRGEAALEKMLAGLREEQRLLGLDAKEREVSITRRRAEEIAIEAGIVDRKELVAQIERESRALAELRSKQGSTGGGVGFGALGQAAALLPGGGNLASVVSQAQGGASALGQFAAAAGAGESALAGLVVAGAGIAVVTLGLGAATAQAHEFDEALRTAVVRSKDASERIAELERLAAEEAVRTATPIAEAGKAISEAYVSGARDVEDATAIVRAANEASVLGFGSISEAVARVDAVNDSFRLKMRDSAQVVRELFVAARDGEAPAGAFADAVARGGTVAEGVGVPLREYAAVLSVVTRNGVEAGAGQQGLSQLLLKLANPLDQTNQRLRAFGVETGRVALEQKGLIGILGEIQRVVAQHPDLALELFGNPRVARAAFQVIEDGGRAARETVVAMANSSDEAGEALERGLNRPGQQIERTWEIVKTRFVAVGGAIEALLAKAIGTEATLAPKIEPDAVTDARKKIAEALGAGDEESAKRIAEGLQKSVDDAIALVVPDQNKVDELLAKIGGNVKPEQLGILSREKALEEARRVVEEAKATGRVGGVLVEQQLDAIRQRALATTDVVKLLNEQLGIAGRRAVDSIEGLGKAVEEPKAKVAELRREFVDLLAGTDAVKLRVEPQIEPAAVAAARKTIEELGKIPKEALSPLESTRLQEATQEVTRYGAALKQAAEVGAKAQIDALAGTDREIAARAQASDAIRRTIVELERQGIVVDELKAAVRELDAVQSEADSRAAERRVRAAEGKALEALAGEIEARGKIARLAGDSDAADRAASEALALRTRAAEEAGRVASSAAAEAARGSEAVADAVGRENEAREETIRLERQAAEDVLRKTFRDREIESIREVDSAERGLLRGLDAEVAKIEDVARARRDQAREDEAAGKITLEALEALIKAANLGEELDVGRAFRDASRGVREELARLTLETAHTAGELADADREVLSIDRERLIEQLKLNGATADEIEQAKTLLSQKEREAEARRRLSRVAGTEDEFELLLRPRLDLDAAILDAEVRRLSEPILARVREALSDPSVSSDELVAQLRAAREELELLRVKAEETGSTFVDSFVNRLRDASIELGSTTANATKLADAGLGAFTSTLTDAFNTLSGAAESGKHSIKDFVESFIRDLARAINQILAFKTASAIIGFLTPGAGVGGAEANTFGGGTVHGLFAEGGVMSGELLGTLPISALGLPIRQYRTGGVARRGSPQIAIFGEGDSDEAFVPLKDGAIPVQIRGGSGGRHSGPMHVELTLHFAPTMTTLDPRSGEEWLRSQAKVLVELFAEQLEGQNSTRLARAISEVG